MFGKKCEVRKKYLSIFILILMLAVYYFFAIQNIQSNKNVLFGEADSYMLPTISLLNHGTMLITEEDIEQAAEDFPEVYNNIRERYDAGRMIVTKDGNSVNPYYFCTYSLICIPLKIIFKLLGCSQTLVFAYTNLLLITGVYFYLFLKLNASLTKRVLLSGLLLANPIYAYVPWQSAEVFIFCMVTLSLIHFMNNKYKSSAFCISLAGTLNVTVMFFGFVLIFDFFRQMYQANKKPLMPFLKYNLKKIVAFGSCFLIVFLPFIHNYIFVGTVNSTFGMADLGGSFLRMGAYFFDLNFGIFAYYPLLLFLLVITLISSIRNHEIKPVILFISMLGIVYSYSLAYHINCGMSGMSRYGAWTTPFLLFICVLFVPFHKKHISYCLFTFTFVIIILFVSMSLQTSYTQMTIWTQSVLEYFPQLYNPLYSTFNSRSNGIDGGYDYTEDIPIIYWSEIDGSMRKALVNNNSIDELLELCTGDEDALNYLKGVFSANEGKEDLFYINIPRKYKIYRNDKTNDFHLEEGSIILHEQPGNCANNGVLYEECVEIKESTYYKIYVQYSCSKTKLGARLVCDLYAGSSYDFSEQEDTLTMYKKEEDIFYSYCILYSGDTSKAEGDIKLRILNPSGIDVNRIDEIYIIEMEVSE